jgi:hypothetical protein
MVLALVASWTPPDHCNLDSYLIWRARLAIRKHLGLANNIRHFVVLFIFFFSVSNLVPCSSLLYNKWQSYLLILTSKYVLFLNGRTKVLILNSSFAIPLHSSVSKLECVSAKATWKKRSRLVIQTPKDEKATPSVGCCQHSLGGCWTNYQIIGESPTQFPRNAGQYKNSKLLHICVV